MTAQPNGVLVSDFDGTMTRHDFYKLVIESLLPPETPDYWAMYRAGTITHFEALRRYFAAIRASEAEVLAVVRRMELDPDVPPLALAEASDGEDGARRVSQDDRQPDVRGAQTACRLEGEAEADGHDDLRDDRDVERAARVAGALEAAGVSERHGDEEAGEQ